MHIATGKTLHAAGDLHAQMLGEQGLREQAVALIERAPGVVVPATQGVHSGVGDPATPPADQNPTAQPRQEAPP